MSKVAIVTDSNSGITQKRGEELGIYVLPMPFFIDGELYLEDITLSQEQFYENWELILKFPHLSHRREMSWICGISF